MDSNQSKKLSPAEVHRLHVVDAQLRRAGLSREQKALRRWKLRSQNGQATKRRAAAAWAAIAKEQQ